MNGWMVEIFKKAPQAGRGLQSVGAISATRKFVEGAISPPTEKEKPVSRGDLL